jgi:putative endonuclease
MSRAAGRKSVDELPERHARGLRAELAAADYLVAEGFRILWRNVRIGALEIDLVAKKGDLVVIAEVRSRGGGAYEKPLASVSYAKQQALLRAARGLWRGRLRKMPDIARVRIDVLAITWDAGGASIEWIRGAFTG